MAESGVRLLKEPSRETPVVDAPDVLVVGGGAAGLAAAVAAARAGADTLLVERYGYLGGLATGGMVILLLTLDDGEGNQVVAGLCQELVERLEMRDAVLYPPAEEWASTEPRLVERYRDWGLIWGKDMGGVRYSVAYEPAEMKYVADQMIAEAGVRMRFHSWATAVVLDGDRVSHVVLESKSGRQAIEPKVVIDATGDGDLMAFAELPFAPARVHVWRWYRMGNVVAPEEAIEAAAGDFFPTLGGRFFHTIGKGRTLMPWGIADHVDRKIDPTSVEDLTYAEVESRRLMMSQVDRLKAEVPGFEEAWLADAADQLGITETRRLVGDYVLTGDDVDRSFDDTIAVTGHWTRYGVRYCIPYRSLTSPRLRNFLASGRCISVDRRIHTAIKEIPPAMATGEAAGTAAALAAAGNGDVRSIETARLQARLRKAGAILDLPS
ncbi:MAG: FAD-dependent oxidoreductase [Alphaproteobacteria bacterium]|jgi:2-polyprenyl-6-methoxyphenol hydroxylase-like FAD-dependent oxidoreductase|nr:FAD-dependent oxidoreductase [Alphaproteobacteria bacterium]